MSEENVKIVRAIYDAYGRGDFAAAFDRIDEDVEWSEPPDNPGAQSWRGHEGVRGALTKWVGAWDDYELDAEFANVWSAIPKVVFSPFARRLSHKGCGGESHTCAQ